ncbi:MAG: Hsp20/alpha crystallin family protein [Thermodesulfobacteriota bacterium]
MAIDKWSPFKEIDRMSKDMDRLWDQVFPTSRRFLKELPVKALIERDTAPPAIDILERPEAIVVRAELPGVDKDNIDISLSDNTLTISGKIEEDKEEKKEDFYYSERTYKSYSRSVDLPCKVDSEKIKANLKNGVLSVKLPKAAEVKAKKITVDVK